VKIILGIDPGLLRTGWGVVAVRGNLLSYVNCGVITPQADADMATRLHHIYSELKKILDNHHPNECAIEEVFVNKNAASSLKLGHARGAAILAVATSGVVVSEYAATLVKKSVVGNGRADKNQVAVMVKYLLPGAKANTADAADALAVAICHISHAGLKAKLLA
jgi:crossover junction endodeoxyribonuclease RuvC